MSDRLQLVELDQSYLALYCDDELDKESGEEIEAVVYMSVAEAAELRDQLNRMNLVEVTE